MLRNVSDSTSSGTPNMSFGSLSHPSMMQIAMPRQSQNRCHPRTPATGTGRCGSGRCCSSTHQHVVRKCHHRRMLTHEPLEGPVLTCRRGQLLHPRCTGTCPGRTVSLHRLLGALKVQRGHGQQQRRSASRQHHSLELAQAGVVGERRLGASAPRLPLALPPALPAHTVSAPCTHTRGRSSFVLCLRGLIYEYCSNWCDHSCFHAPCTNKRSKVMLWRVVEGTSNRA